MLQRVVPAAANPSLALSLAVATGRPYLHVLKLKTVGDASISGVTGHCVTFEDTAGASAAAAAAEVRPLLAAGVAAALRVVLMAPPSMHGLLRTSGLAHPDLRVAPAVVFDILAALKAAGHPRYVGVDVGALDTQQERAALEVTHCSDWPPGRWRWGSSPQYAAGCTVGRARRGGYLKQDMEWDSPEFKSVWMARPRHRRKKPVPIPNLVVMYSRTTIYVSIAPRPTLRKCEA